MDRSERLERLNRKFQKTIAKMIENAPHTHAVITEHNVYQEGDPKNKELMQSIIHELMLPGSRLIGFENLIELYKLAQSGNKCLILMEHYSNFDIPCFYDLMERQGDWGLKVSKSIVSVAGLKLNEDSALVRSFTEIFTRVVIFPKSRLENAKDETALKEALDRRKKINLAALKKLFELRKSGRLILVFPTGTRYRPWDPSTGKGQKEIDSYIKSYDYMVLVAINGNTLRLDPNGNMDEDIPTHDIMMYTVSEVKKCRDYRANALKDIKPDENVKQHVVDKVMEDLKKLHNKTEQIRKPLLEKFK
ncbi:MAG: 1-acyl-sn-glycerol-3-phosphate acyltransferase [Spirochaetales bacterium]|nr:1-acyl-sn-glycerol-3-phosphate acyltransferase [Spirochaetales bacterium]